jgi:hypothetical protein
MCMLVTAPSAAVSCSRQLPLAVHPGAAVGTASAAAGKKKVQRPAVVTVSPRLHTSTAQLSCS